MKGILFKADMIKAIVEGRKTETRRIIKPQPDRFCSFEPEGWQTMGHSYKWTCAEDTGAQIWKPRYLPGEVVYIKEALFRWTGCGDAPSDFINVRPRFDVCYRDNPQFNSLQGGACLVTISPLFMPAWAARHFIKVISVEPQRLQAITEEQAVAEGCADLGVINSVLPHYEGDLPNPYLGANYYPAVYRELWNSINKPPYDWGSNPWVWRYCFELLDNKRT